MVSLYGFWRRESLLTPAQFDPQNIQLVTSRSSGYGIHSKVKTKVKVTPCHAYVGSEEVLGVYSQHMPTSALGGDGW
jgi:hypothetical protein